jgi:polysaccharide export outer membrane protein
LARRIADTQGVKRHVCSALVLALFGLGALGGLGGCGPKVPNYDYASEPDPRKLEYVLGVGDGLNINVWEQPNFSTTATIRPDGTITMPLIGDLKAAGETPSALREAIKARLADFLKNSEVTIAVTSSVSYRFTISGEVSHAGVFNSAYYVTVADAIALAGGFTRFARRNEMVLMRRDPRSGEIRHIPLYYDLLANGKRPDMNLVLLSGDSLYVP